MNGTQPPVPGAPVPKSGLPAWALVLIIVGGVSLFVVFVFIIGTLAAIAIPKFVPSRDEAQAKVCTNNLRKVESAIQSWALEKGKKESDTVTQADIVSYIKEGVFPNCPAGGSYTIGRVDELPTCSKTNHFLPGPTLKGY